MIKLGNENFFKRKYASCLKGARIGLITHSAGVTRDLEHFSFVLRKYKDVKLTCLFSPEHGFYGDIEDEIHVKSRRERGIFVHSLFGKNLMPTEKMLDKIDAVLFELQDVGVRFYTYISTMALAMKSCAERGIQFFVLDRPNPIGGIKVEGNVLREDFSSFLGIYPIALRHGMTVGELAKYFNLEFNIGVKLTVVPMSGWRRKLWFDNTGHSWVAPSPNMPTLSTAIVYPGTCLFEGTNVSEGRGTTKPFEIVGAPWIDGLRLEKIMNEKYLRGVKFRETFFIPHFGKFKGIRCNGIQVHVIDRESFEPVRVGLELICAIRILHPEKFRFKRKFDFLMGTDEVRKKLERGEQVRNIMDNWKNDIGLFLRKRKKYLIYE